MSGVADHCERSGKSRDVEYEVGKDKVAVGSNESGGWSERAPGSTIVSSRGRASRVKCSLYARPYGLKKALPCEWRGR